MNRFVTISLVVAVVLCGCAEKQPKPTAPLSLQGQWLVETNGEVMLDPQTSGLKFWRGKLLSVSDASADQSQRKQLHIIDPLTAQLAADSLPMMLSERVQQSCFAGYLSDSPDLEALAIDPRNDNVFVVVTEDATRSTGMSEECHQRYKMTGSTDYPTVLIRLELQDDNSLLMTHARPIQYDPVFNLGDFPNDGVEGLAFGQDNILYLGVEKDAKGHARIFSLQINDDFWLSDEFAAVSDPQLFIPTYDSGNHPVNAMDYLPVADHKGFIVAAARNDDQLWIIDLEKQQPTRIVSLQFLAPTLTSSSDCEPWELMDNASIEGLAVANGRIWMINDPWRKNYMLNVQCESNRPKYQKMAPLLFSLPLEQVGLLSNR
ncbi:hypothetical protein [Aliiglaciecola litoralis]|uniref:Phytase-like domain-containing protein n=1 Tax=Aliiglaciecola litoralis TaxID=582857 RepID=A0ABN1LDZ8_9ALTE